MRIKQRIPRIGPFVWSSKERSTKESCNAGAETRLDDVPLSAGRHRDKSGRGGNEQMEEGEERAHFV